MPLDWEQDALANGLACYRSQQFFEAHEYWEEVWMLAQAPEKQFLQGLIHVTVAFHHLRGGNQTGAARQLRRALQKLDPFPARFEGVSVEHVRANIRAWLQALEDSRSIDGLLYPDI